MDDAEISLLEARVSALEAKNETGSQEQIADAEFMGERARAENVDQKGRKPFECEWNPETESMVMYVPEGALIYDEEEIEIEDIEDEEIEIGSGTWYLNISKNGDEITAEISQEENGGSKLNIKLATISENGDEVETQYVSSVIVISDDEQIIPGQDNYEADEKSISRRSWASGETIHTNHFSLKGFGRFTPPNYQDPIGSFAAAATQEITVDAEEATQFAVVCRDGNVDEANANSISYRKLKIKSGSGGESAKLDPSPFMIETTRSGQLVTKKIVNCMFYWEGVLQTINDFEELPTDGAVYIRGIQEEPTREYPNPNWTWTIGTTEQTASEHQKVLNFKLYDFEDGKVKIDYRTTFLTLEDTTQKSLIVVGRIGEQESITIDATDNNPSMTISDGTKSIELATSDLPNEVNDVRVHKISYEDEEGEEQSFVTIADKDVNIGKTKKVKSLNELTGDLNILGGRNIKVEIRGKNIIISFVEDKEPDPIPITPGEETDPCEHPGSGKEGGVNVSEQDQSGSSGEGKGGSSSGGVQVEGESHPGDPCNCNNN